MTLKEFYRLYDGDITRKIREALREDSVNNDVTSKLLNAGSALADKTITARLLCKQDCLLAGVEVFKRTFTEVNKSISFKQSCHDGDRVSRNAVVLRITGSPYDLLRAERTAINFIQRMTGIATLTSWFVKKLKYPSAMVLHTRKTTPNFRLFEAAAVKLGGGDFHRLSLGSSVLIKDNHIKSVGSIKRVFELISSRKLPRKLQGKFEIEVKSIAELRQVLLFGKGIIKVVMLDNFPVSRITEAVSISKKQGLKVELSGGIDSTNFGKLQFQGIDFYSIGMLTHSYKSADFSLEF